MTRVLPEPAPARNQQRAVDVLDRRALFGVEAVEQGVHRRLDAYSTVTLLARLRGWSTSHPRRTPMW